MLDAILDLIHPLQKENADLREKNEKLYELGLNENTARFEDMKKIERLEDALKDKIKRNEELIKDSCAFFCYNLSTRNGAQRFLNK